ncbi:ClbS/DfsB family four-helix bundle protein [Iodobacter fluviatilis]|nr:ClbS/DfsB family four-helix bundle protein [Iodobacter fluviatilis]
MPLPCNKAELLLNFDSAYSKLINELATIPEQDTRRPEIESKISTCDLLAYQIGWGRLLLQWDKDELPGKTAQMPTLGFK